MSAQATQQLNRGHLSELGWRHEKEDGRSYLRNVNTGAETARYDFPGPAFDEALEMERGGAAEEGAEAFDAPRPARTSAFWAELAKRERESLPTLSSETRYAMKQRTIEALETLAWAYDRGELTEALIGLNQKAQVARLVHNDEPPTDAGFDDFTRKSLAEAGIDTPEKYAAARAALLRLVGERAAEQGDAPEEPVASFSTSDEVEKEATPTDPFEAVTVRYGEERWRTNRLTAERLEALEARLSAIRLLGTKAATSECLTLIEERARLLGLTDGIDLLDADDFHIEAVPAETVPQWASDDAPAVAIKRGAPSSDTVLLDPALVRTDGGTQARAALDESTVADYAEKMLAGEAFPEVIVFFDGTDYWLADGFHRHAATVRAELAEIAADVRQGTRRDAVLYAVGANARHGLRRSDADKRRAVETLLADPEWSKWSNREVARQCGVSKGFVGDVRAGLTGARAPEEVVARRGDSEYTVSTKNLAGPKTAPAEATPSGAAQTPAPETEAAPTPSRRDEAEGEDTQPAAASAGAPDSSFTVTDRRIRHDAEAAPVTHPAPRPDRVAELKKRLKGRALVISHTFMGDMGVLVTANVAGAPPEDAVISALFPPEKVRWLGDAEYEVACQRLDAEKREPKPAKKAAAKKSSKKAAAKSQTPAAKAPTTKGLPSRKYAIGDVVRVTDRKDRNFGMRGEVRGHYTENNDKFQVKVGVKYYDYLGPQLAAEKKTATRGATKKAPPSWSGTTDGPGPCRNCSKRIRDGRTHTHIAQGKCAEYNLPAKGGSKKGAAKKPAGRK